MEEETRDLTLVRPPFSLSEVQVVTCSKRYSREMKMPCSGCFLLAFTYGRDKKRGREMQRERDCANGLASVQLAVLCISAVVLTVLNLFRFKMNGVLLVEAQTRTPREQV